MTNPVAQKPTVPTPAFRRKIFRVPNASYLREWESALETHTDVALEAVRAQGFDAVWLHAILREISRTAVFPELGIHAETGLKTLNALLARCRRHGLDVFLYLNEPMGFPAADPFWQHHPETRGEPGSSPDDGWDHSFALCTSTQAVRDFLFESTRHLFSAAPELAGAFLITASEHHTHCYSHDAYLRRRRGEPIAGFQCPRCSSRTPAEVVGEIVRLVQAGAKTANPAAEVIAWNWSWMMYEPDPQADVINHLPEGVALLADFERGGSRKISLAGGTTPVDRTAEVDEYSLAYIGPSPRFLGTLAAAQARGVPCYAKLQIGTTHEIATVPNLPLIPHIYRKFQAMHAHGVKGFLACWNFGADPSLNTFAVGRLTQGETFPDEKTFLDSIGQAYFPGGDPAKITEAWHAFCSAMEMHPFSMDFVYQAPVNHAVVFPWKLEKPSRPLAGSWYVLDDYGDMLEQCRGTFTLAEIETLLTELVRRWNIGVAALTQGLSSAQQSIHATQELGVARMIGHQFHSTRNIFRFHQRRATWLENPTPAATAALREVIQDELTHLPACLPLVEADDRLGMHPGSFPAPHRFYDAPRIRQHIVDLEALHAKLSG